MWGNGKKIDRHMFWFNKKTNGRICRQKTKKYLRTKSEFPL